MKLFCANCGLPLSLARKAMPKLGIIVDLVNYHECVSELVPFDINALVPKAIEGKQKFVLSLNTLDASKPFQSHSKETERPRGFQGVGTDDLCDRRFGTEEGAKSSAPNSIVDQIRQMSNSIPAHEASEIPEGLRKDDTDSAEMGD